MSQTLLVVAAGALGACIGSFLNVVIHRLPQEDPAARALGGRSRCPACRAPIRWYDNLPVLGWLHLRGKARCCGARIAVRYPLVEALTALLFVLLAAYGPDAPLATTLDSGALVIDWTHVLGFLFHAAFAALLIACSFIDLDHMLLPDRLTLPGMVLGLCAAYLVPGIAGTVPGVNNRELASLLASGLGLGAGYGAAWLVHHGARPIFQKEALGFGDVKFLGMIGAFLGWEGALLTFFLGCLVGAVGGVLHKLLTRQQYIPFGPFLAIGALLELFFRAPILDFLFVTLPEIMQRSQSAYAWLMVATVLSILALVILVRRGRGSR
jgi:leader peptidase (prepilin peptidase)/N-methyltransferase